MVKNILEYFSERFPIYLVVFLSMAYSFMLLGVISSLSNKQIGLLELILVAISFFGFMLRIRVTDEFKDRSHDDKYYPGRPLQRGLINPRQLVLIGITATIFELLAIYIINPNTIIFYLPVIVYSILTAKEFFASSWLQKHFNYYFLTHQLIFFAFVFWGFMTYEIKLDILSIYGALALVCTMTVFEIMRKLEYRYSKNNQLIKDTYLAVWGVPLTMSILICLILIVGISLMQITGNVYFLLLSLIACLFTSSNNFNIIRLVFSMTLFCQGIILFI